MKANRVAITGLGAICGLGHNLKTVWENLVNGKSGISTIENTDTEQWSIKIAGEVKNFQISEDLLGSKDASRYDRFVHFALHCANEAYKDAGLINNTYYAPEKIGTILGVGMGGFPLIEENHKNYLEKGPRRVSPFFIPAIIPNMSTGLISIKLGIKGVNFTVASACASATHAISVAASEIISGRQDVMISGGAESVICNTPISGFINMKALSKRNEEPERASRPFDVDRDGFVMGEGAGIVVLENYEKAVARGAKIYAELVGFGYSSDAHHITAPHPEGDGAAQCMKQTIELAGITPEMVGYINAHGTSTPLGDIAEIKAVKKVFGDHVKKLYCSSTKSMTGHLLGAAGGIELVFSAMTLHNGIIPPTINVENQDPECDINCVPNKCVKYDGEYALSNSFGFGGTNSSVLIKKVN